MTLLTSLLWLAVGMALHSVADDLLEDWDSWSNQIGSRGARSFFAVGTPKNTA